MGYIYADNAATTKMSRHAAEVMLGVIENNYANPSSLHTPGQLAAVQLAESRQTIAKILNCEPREIIFTGGGSEADNQALLSAAAIGQRKGKKHIISTKFEHHAVLHTLKKLEKQGFEVTYLDVYENGIVRPEDVKAAIRPDTVLVSVMYANNEIGTIQPIRAIGAICREQGVLFHTDAVQAVGHLPIDVQADNIDMLSLSAHKFHGPKGVGALYVRRGYNLAPVFLGGGQEQKRRPGTENVAYIAAMARAIERMLADGGRAGRIAALNKTLRDALAGMPGIVLNSPADALPELVNFSVEGVKSETMLHFLESRDVYVSSGSACSRGEASHTLTAMGLPKSRVDTALRVSFSGESTPEDVRALLDALAEGMRTLAKIRR